MSDIERNAFVIGLTGGIACGKSEVGRILGKMGFAVCDADRVAHDLMAKGTAVYKDVVEAFGKGILLADGAISRPALGRIVFDNPQHREQLNRLVHPAVKKALASWIAEHREKRVNCVVQIPLLFESGMETLDFDAIICVSSSKDLIYKRLEKRGLRCLEADKWIHSQMPLVEKERLSDCVVRNQGTLQELEEATRLAVESVGCVKGRL